MFTNDSYCGIKSLTRFWGNPTSSPNHSNLHPGFPSHQNSLFVPNALPSRHRAPVHLPPQPHLFHRFQSQSSNVIRRPPVTPPLPQRQQHLTRNVKIPVPRFQLNRINFGPPRHDSTNSMLLLPNASAKAMKNRSRTRGFSDGPSPMMSNKSLIRRKTDSRTQQIYSNRVIPTSTPKQQHKGSMVVLTKSSSRLARGSKLINSYLNLQSQSKQIASTQKPRRQSRDIGSNQWTNSSQQNTRTVSDSNVISEFNLASSMPQISKPTVTSRDSGSRAKQKVGKQTRNFKKMSNLNSSTQFVPKTSIDKQRKLGSKQGQSKTGETLDKLRDASIKNFIYNKYQPKSLQLSYKPQIGRERNKLNSGRRQAPRISTVSSRVQSVETKSKCSGPKTDRNALLKYPNILGSSRTNDKRRVQSSQNNRNKIDRIDAKQRLLNSNISDANNQIRKQSAQNGSRKHKAKSPDLRSGLFESQPHHLKNLLNSVEFREDQQRGGSLPESKSKPKRDLIVKISSNLEKRQENRASNKNEFVSPIPKAANFDAQSQFLFSTQKKIETAERKSSEKKGAAKEDINTSLVHIGKHLTSILSNIKKGQTEQDFREHLLDSNHQERVDNLGTIISELEMQQPKLGAEKALQRKKNGNSNNRYSLDPNESLREQNDSALTGGDIARKVLKWDREKLSEPGWRGKTGSQRSRRDSKQQNLYCSEMNVGGSKKKQVQVAKKESDSGAKGKRRELGGKQRNLSSMLVLRNEPHFSGKMKNKSLSQKSDVGVEGRPRKIEYRMWDPKRSNSRIIHKTREYLYEFLDLTYKQKGEPKEAAQVEGGQQPKRLTKGDAHKEAVAKPLKKKKKKAKVKKKPEKKPKSKKRPQKKKKAKRAKKPLGLGKKFFFTKQEDKSKKPKKKKAVGKKRKPKKPNKDKVVSRKTRRVTKYVGPKNGPKVRKSVVLTVYETKKKAESKINTGLRRKSNNEYVTTVRTSVLFGNSTMDSVSKNKKSLHSSSVAPSSEDRKQHESLFVPRTSIEKSQKSLGRRKLRTSSTFAPKKVSNYNAQNESMNVGAKVFSKHRSKPTIFLKNKSNRELGGRMGKLNQSDLGGTDAPGEALDLFPKKGSQQVLEPKGEGVSRGSRRPNDEKNEKKAKRGKVKSGARKADARIFRTIGDPKNVERVKTSIDKMIRMAEHLKESALSGHSSRPKSPFSNKNQTKSDKELVNLTKRSKNPKSKKQSLPKPKKKTQKKAKANRPKTSTTSSILTRRAAERKAPVATKLVNAPSKPVKPRKPKVDKIKRKPKKLAKLKSLVNSRIRRAIPILQTLKSKAQSTLKNEDQSRIRKKSLVLDRKPPKPVARFRKKSQIRPVQLKSSHQTKKRRKKINSTELTFDEFQKMVGKPASNAQRKVAGFKRKRPDLTIEIESEPKRERTPDGGGRLDGKSTRRAPQKASFEDMETPKTSSFKKEPMHQKFEESLVIESKQIGPADKGRPELAEDRGQFLDPGCAEYVFNSKKLFVFRNAHFKAAEALPHGLSLLRDISDFGKKVIEDNLNLVSHFEHFEKSGLRTGSSNDRPAERPDAPGEVAARPAHARKEPVDEPQQGGSRRNAGLRRCDQNRAKGPASTGARVPPGKPDGGHLPFYQGQQAGLLPGDRYWQN